jgi:hypothetical protein
MQRQRRRLTLENRVAIDLRRQDGWGVRELGHPPSMISTEIGCGQEPDGHYAAGPAQATAAARWDRSGRRAKLAPDSPCLARWRSCCGCSGRQSRSPGDASAWRMGRRCHPECRCRTRRSTPCRAVSCGASCSPACARASRTAADGPRTANGGAGSATCPAFGNARRRWTGAWRRDVERAI